MKMIYLVGANTTSFESFRRQLLVLVGNQVNTQREVLYAGLLTTQIEDANLGVGDTSAKARLGVRLIFAVAVARQ